MSGVKRSLKSPKSRGGCQRCRTKRIKCDETRPACNTCLANGLQCPGYTRQLRWSSKHEVFARPPHDRPHSKGKAFQHESQSSGDDTVISVSQSEAVSGRDNVTTITADTVVERPHPTQDINVDMGAMDEMFDWPNFEMCGFGDLGLSTPTMGQDSNAELDALCSMSVSSQPIEAIPHSMGSDGLIKARNPIGNFIDDERQRDSPEQGCDNSVVPNPAQNESSTCTESVSLLQTFYRLAIPCAIPGFSDSDLVSHFFSNICTIYSCFDSDMNPFRTLVAEQFPDCRTTFFAIQAMSASHLANFYPHMQPLGLAKRSQAWLALQRDFRQVREGKQSAGKVLLCLLLLGLSSTWHSSSNLGLEYLYAARNIVQKMLRSSQGVTTAKDEFFLDALMHWEMMASFVDPVPLVPLSGLKSPEPKLPSIQGPKMPHPWTGVVKELHFILAEIGRVLRRQRHLAFAAGLSTQRRDALREQDDEWMGKLERMILEIPTPEADNIVDYEDPKTPKADLIRAAEAYRYIGLLEIYNAAPAVFQVRLSQASVPDALAAVLAADGEVTIDTNKLLSNIAHHVLEIIRPISVVSGACRLLPLVLLSCAGHVRFPDKASLKGTDETTANDHFVEVRYFMEARLMTLSRKFPQKPLLQMMDIVKEVWSRLDAGLPGAHWMDVALDNGWQTIFG